MSVSSSQSASLTINGVSPAAGAGFTLLASPSLQSTGVTQGDYFAETFTVNPSTPPTVQSIGDIATGRILWIQTDRTINVILVQPTGTNTIAVDSFLYVNTAFTSISLANTNATNAAHINMVVVGDRIVNPGTPGIY